MAAGAGLLSRYQRSVPATVMVCFFDSCAAGCVCWHPAEGRGGTVATGDAAPLVGAAAVDDEPPLLAPPLLDEQADRPTRPTRSAAATRRTGLGLRCTAGIRADPSRPRTADGSGDHARRAQLGQLVGREPELVDSTSSVCSPSHGTRVSGPSATFDIFTGLPGTRHRLLDAVRARHLDEHAGARRRADPRRTSSAVLHGPTARPAAASSEQTSSFDLLAGPGVDRRADRRRRGDRPNPGGWRSGGRRATRGGRPSWRRRSNWCSRLDLHRRTSRRRPRSPVTIAGHALARLRRACPATRSS